MKIISFLLSKVKPLFYSFVAISVATALFVPSAEAKVYVAGLKQARFTNGQNDYTSDINSAETLTYAAGTVMANTTTVGYDWAGKEWSWASDVSFGYLGEMYMNAGVTYWFGKSVDDMTYLVISNSVKIQNTVWDKFISASYTPETSGWVPVEIRFGNGGGGAGLSQGATYGFAYNTNGKSDWDTFKVASDGWTNFRDIGDASLLRTVYSETDLMSVGGIVKDGNDLKVTLSFTDMPTGGASAIVCYGASDGGTDTNSWDSTSSVEIAAGDTASTTYTVPGGGSANYVAVKLIGTTIPIYQWSDAVNLNSSAPIITLAATDVSYTNASFSTAIQSIGAGASSISARLEISTAADFSEVQVTKALETTDVGAESITVNGLSTGTAYYARVVGTNNQNDTGFSTVVTFTTLSPGTAEGSITLTQCGFTSFSAICEVTTFGVGSESATVSFEASDASDFATIVGSSGEVSATTDSPSNFVIFNLDPGTAYYLRLKIENEWGLITYYPLSGAYSTQSVPLTAAGIGYRFSSVGDTVDISFAVNDVFDGATCSVKLEYNGAVVGSQDVSTASVLTWQGVAAASGNSEAKVTVSATVGGTTYSHVWTVPVVLGSTAVAVSSVTDYASAATAIRMYPGDTVTLPEIYGNASYTVMNNRFASLDGNVLTATEPGIVGVRCIDNASVTNTLAVLVLPDPIEDGEIYIFNENASTREHWMNAVTWERLGSDTNDSWPQNPNDIAIIPFYSSTGSKYLRHMTDFSIGGIIFGSFCDVDATCVIERHQDAGSTKTVTFSRTDGESAFVKTCANTTTSDRKATLQFGGYDINLVCASSVETDGCSSKTDSGLCRGFISYSKCTINIPEGNCYIVDGLPGHGVSMGSTVGAPNLSGSGVFWKKGMGGFRFENLPLFDGTILDTSHGNHAGFDRAAPTFWHGPGGTNVSITVAGCVRPQLGTPSCSTSGYGWFRTGWDPAYGAESPHPEVPWNPRKTMMLRGGAYQASSTENPAWGVGSRVTRIYEKLLIGPGMNYVVEGDRDTTKGHPINYIEWNALEHEEKGSLVIYDPSRRYVASATQTNAMTVIKNHDVFLVGINGDCATSDVYPIIPWMIAPASTSDGSWQDTLFASFDAEGRLVRPECYNTALDEAASEYSNAYLWDKTIEIGNDVTLNSLFMNNSNKNKYLGEGRVLTLTSGGLVMHGKGAAIGLPGRVDNGSLVLGDANNPGYVFAKSNDRNNPNQIWADVTAPGGFVSSYSGALVLGGDQTKIADEIVVNAGILQLGNSDYACTLAKGLPLRVSAGATLSIPQADTVSGNILYVDGVDGAFGKMEVPGGMTAKVRKVYWRDYPETGDWQTLPRGDYSGDAATALANGCIYDPMHFSGSGIVRVLRDDLVNPFTFIVR